jgi:hypothetical protein
MHLDNFTAITIVAAVAFVFGFGLLLFHGIQRSFRGLAALGTAYLLLGAGSALIALRGQIPDWASIILSNAMIVSGIATMDEGLSRFVHDRKGHRLTAAALVVLLMAVQFSTSAPSAPDLQVRIIFISVIMATMCALVTHSLLAPQPGRGTPRNGSPSPVTATRRRCRCCAPG